MPIHFNQLVRLFNVRFISLCVNLLYYNESPNQMGLSRHSTCQVDTVLCNFGTKHTEFNQHKHTTVVWQTTVLDAMLELSDCITGQLFSRIYHANKMVPAAFM